MSLTASIIVPTFNRPAIMERCVRALQRQTAEFDYEVIIVDDGSHDETRGVIRRLEREFPNIRSLRNETNAGRCKTRNRGILASNARLIIMVDDDVVVGDGFVKAHCQVYDDNASERIAVIGNMKYAAECVQGSNMGRYLQSRYLCFRDEARIHKDDLQPQHFGTMNCSFRKEDALRVGLLDERFRYYGGEDVFFGYKLRSIGVRLVFCREAVGVHWDIVDIGRQRTKMIQTARNGWKTILNDAPGLLASTHFRYFMPFDARIDSVRTRLIKISVKLVTIRGLARMAECVAKWTDHIPWLYSKMLFGYLMANWTAAGLRESRSESEMVSYGEEEARHLPPDL
jgi:GT2 family glycosyltransferase